MEREREDAARSEGGEDPVLALLDATAGAYRAHDTALRGELASARADAEHTREAETSRAEAAASAAGAADEIPVAARIVAVVDAYCAMITRRSYKEAYTEAHARE